MTTIERVAYALERLHLGGDFDWSRFHPEAKEMRLEQARAALQAIREVPESISNVAAYDEYDWAGRNFTAMIDAILNEQPEP